MNDYRYDRAVHLHDEAAAAIEDIIAVDAVSIYPIGSDSFGIEVSLAGGVFFHENLGDEDEAHVFAEGLKSQLDWIEEQGLDRNDQQVFIVQFIRENV